jgi:multidrug efflux pump subunit AcrA (membrane-fusion protein)
MITARSQAKFLLPILVLLIAAAIYFSLVNSKVEREKPALSEKVWQVEVITAQKQELSPSITLYGRIESPEQLKAAAPGGGIVEQVFVRDAISQPHCCRPRLICATSTTR